MTKCWSVSIRSCVANHAPRPHPATILAVAIGGAAGAIARVFLPWPTVLDDSLSAFDPLPLAIICLSGAALLGLVTGYSSRRRWPEPVIKGVTTGFFGAFTTMSGLAVAYAGLTFGVTIYAASSVLQGIMYAAGIVAVLLAFLFVTTLVTLWMLKFGTYLAGERT